MKKIAFIVQQPKEYSPSQRFRVELWEDILLENGYEFETFPFLDVPTIKILYQQGHLLQKVWGVFKGFSRRICSIPKLVKYDYLFIQREMSPIGPPIFEYILAKWFKKKLIFDFDDAIWITDKKHNPLMGFVKNYQKIPKIIKWSYKVAAGNDVLLNYAKTYNPNSFKIPTCVDTIHYHNQLKNQHTNKVVIGWTGSHSTMVYLDTFMPVYERLLKKYDLELIIISNKAPTYQLPSITYIPWNAKTEIEDLLRFNIGVMPLVNDLWSEGKCGFKLIQYLALGIPAVASPVGINTKIIEPKNGYLCTTDEEWYQALETLIVNEQLRKNMGEAGRQKIQSEFCIHAIKSDFLQLFT